MFLSWIITPKAVAMCVKHAAVSLTYGRCSRSIGFLPCLQTTSTSSVPLLLSTQGRGRSMGPWILSRLSNPLQEIKSDIYTEIWCSFVTYELCNTTVRPILLKDNYCFDQGWCWEKSVFHFFNVLFIETGRDRAWTGEGQREGDRMWNRLQAPSCQHRARRRARTHQLWDHDVSQSPTLTWLSHTELPSR